MVSIVAARRASCFGATCEFSLTESRAFGFSAQLHMRKKTMTWLGSFNGSSPKPLQIWHIAEEYSELRRPRPDSNETPDKLYSVAVGPGGQKRFSGKKRLMKESQAYTCNFARAVAAVTLRNARPV